MDLSLNESPSVFFSLLARQLPMWCVLSWQGNCWDLNPPSRPCSPLLCRNCAPAFRNDVNGWWRRTRAHSEVFEDWRLITSPRRQCWYVCPYWRLYSHCIYSWTWSLAGKIKIFWQRSLKMWSKGYRPGALCEPKDTSGCKQSQVHNDAQISVQTQKRAKIRKIAVDIHVWMFPCFSIFGELWGFKHHVSVITTAAQINFDLLITKATCI